MQFYIAGVYGNGQMFPEILVSNSLLLHTIVLKNRFLFSGTFCKGNIRLMCCESRRLGGTGGKKWYAKSNVKGRNVT